MKTRQHGWFSVGALALLPSGLSLCGCNHTAPSISKPPLTRPPKVSISRSVSRQDDAQRERRRLQPEERTETPQLRHPLLTPEDVAQAKVFHPLITPDAVAQAVPVQQHSEPAQK